MNAAADLPQFDCDRIQYSDRYHDEVYEYRHVMLPHEPRDRHLLKRLNRLNRLLSEDEWRYMGLQMSPGWQHYGGFEPEPFVMLFRRPRVD